MSRHSTTLPAPMEATMLRGGVVLTPNQRVARCIAAAFNGNRAAEGKGSWAPAAVMPWSAWTAAAWAELLIAGQDDRVLLNNVQESSLWQSVIAEQSTPGLTQSGALPAMCAKAHRLLGNFLALYRLPAYLHSASGDAQTFGRWLRSFGERCKAEGLLPAAELEAALAVAIRLKRGRWRPAAEFILFGFDQLLPSQQALVRALESRGCAVTAMDANEGLSVQAPVLVAAPEIRSEMQACAEWVRQKLDRRSDLLIALIVPDLPACAPEIERVLREVVAPEFEDVGRDEGTVPWHIAEGRPLTDLRMVADALRMLRWLAGPLRSDEISALLLSPYMTLVDDEMDGAAIDAFVLRSMKLHRAEMSITGTASQCGARRPAFAKRLQELAEKARSLGKPRSFARWGESARDLLQQAGWPGTRTRTSEEFQLGQRWDEVLDQLASLDLVEQECSYAGFVQRLMQCCATTRFARENTDVPVQVMTPSEAAGSSADALWFLHGTEAGWNSRQTMHPLLPLQLQRKFGMPGADGVRDGEAVSQRTRRLAASASEVRFSYAETGDEGAQRPSAEILALSQLERETAEVRVAEAVRLQLENVEDTSPVPALPDAVVRGGVSILKNQAACPFRAFSEMRLFSREVEEGPLGLDVRERGNLVHKTLEHFWRDMRSHAALLASTGEYEDGQNRRDRLLEQCIDQAFGAVPKEPWEAEYVAVQKERLFRIVSRWLDKEAARPAFEVVQIEESVKDVRLGPLRVDLRVDRVDRVGKGEDAATVLIDYKTGKVQLTDWDGDRPEEPQLPMYAVASGMPDVGAVAFASVRAGDLWLDGWPCKSPLLPDSRKHKPDTDFAEQRLRWGVVLTGLARQFADGDASVDPKEYPVTCKHCSQRPLCRLDPAALTAVLEQDDYQDEDTAS